MKDLRWGNDDNEKLNHEIWHVLLALKSGIVLEDFGRQRFTTSSSKMTRCCNCRNTQVVKINMIRLGKPGNDYAHLECLMCWVKRAHRDTKFKLFLRYKTTGPHHP